jgi:ferric-dicitrate binding protein FerR (iron transport regulator)
MQSMQDLFQRFIDGKCTQDEFNELMDLLRKQENEPQVRAMLQKVYELTAQGLTSETYVNQQGELHPIKETKVFPVQPKRRTAGSLLIAASIVGVLLLGWWLFNMRYAIHNGTLSLAGQTAIITKKAEQKYLLLPDSTRVWLNAASELDYPVTFNGKVREVVLKGEAFFDVKHIEGKSFVIHSGEVTTRVLGTAFNIRAYPGQADVVISVKRGRVEVTHKDKVVAVLTVGQQVKVMLQPAPANETKINEDDVAAWTVGKLHFEKQTFGDIIADLERTYNGTIELRNKELESEVITTSFRKDIGIEQALRILCELTGAKLSIENGTYIIQ